MIDGPHDTLGQHCCLAAAWRGQYQMTAFTDLYHLLLFLIEYLLHDCKSTKKILIMHYEL